MFVVLLAARLRGAGPMRPAPTVLRGRRVAVVVTAVACVAVFGAALVGAMLGDTVLLTGGLLNRALGRAGPIVTYVLDARVPRVLPR